MSIDRLPKTDSIQELARFWETHDLTDYEDELEEVTEPAFRRETVVSVYLPAQEADALRRLAEAKGIESSELLREWVRERVHTGS